MTIVEMSGAIWIGTAAFHYRTLETSLKQPCPIDCKQQEEAMEMEKHLCLKKAVFAVASVYLSFPLLSQKQNWKGSLGRGSGSALLQY